MAELALAIVPLIISAVEHYSEVSTAISRFRHFSDEVDIFFAELHLQCGIFRTAVQLLLASAVGDEQAARMLHDETHLGWKDPDLDLLISQRFSDCAASVIACMKLVHRHIESLQDVSETFKDAIEEVDRVSAVDPAS